MSLRGEPPPPPSFPPPPPAFPPPPPAFPPPPLSDVSPAQAPVTYAGFWIRLGAFVIDYLVILVANFGIGFVLGIGLVVAGADARSASARFGLFAIGFAIYFLYFTVQWSLGQTLGMRIFNLRVVDAQTGAAIGFGAATRRFLGFFISTIACYAGLIWAAFDGRKQGWHDKMASTLVLRGA